MVKLTLLLSIFLLVSCGKDVSVSSTKLKNQSSLSDGQAATPNADGLIKRGTKDTITTNGSTYNISIYSSYQALEFVAAKPLGTQVQVRFKGKTKNGEMVLEVVQ